MNPFNEETRLLFYDAWKCWVCGKNTADSLHHIVGRGAGDSMVESSTLNAAPLCNQSCHLPNHGLLRTDEHVRKMLNQTYNYLMEVGYAMNEIDEEFLIKYAEKY